MLEAPNPFSVNQPERARLYYLDNLKVVLTVVVILHHVGQPYGSGGWWYVQDPQHTPLLGPFFWLNASFFMGLFFFVSAYFIPGSFDRKGSRAFITDRLIRLGIPLVVFFLAIIPAQMYLNYIKFRGGSLPFPAYYLKLYFGLGAKPAGWTGPSWPDMQFGHLWFVQHLLVYALLYALFRRLVAASADEKLRGKGRLPGDGYLIGYALAMSAVTLLVRQWYPVDRWVGVLGFIQTEPAHLPQYASMFVLGIVACRRSWLDQVPLGRGLAWLAVGTVAFVAGRLLPLSAWLGKPWAGAAMTFAEGFVAVGLSVGLVALFKARLNRTGRLWQALSANAFAAYVFHVPVAIGLQYAALALPAGPLVKFAVTGLLAVPITFAVSHLIRQHAKKGGFFS